jgi:uncharacterized protein YybS (DUF2232 family)
VEEKCGCFDEICQKKSQTVFQADNIAVSKDIFTGIAITMIIYAISVHMPIIGFFCSLLLPLPVLFYRSKLGRKNGMLIPVAATGIMIFISGTFSMDIMFFMELLMIGFLLSEFFEQNLTVEKTILYTCGAILFIGFIGLLFYSNVVGKTIYLIVSNYIAKNLEMTMALYKSMGVSEENMVKLSESLDKIRYVFIRILPALVIASSLFVTWSNLLMARPILNKRGLFFPDFGSLNLWKAPEALVWLLIGSGILLLIPAGTLKIVGLNCLLVVLVIYFFQGIAVVSYFFKKKRFPRFLRLTFYTLLAIQQLFLLFVIGLGLFDVWLNFRKINATNNDSAST